MSAVNSNNDAAGLAAALSRAGQGDRIAFEEVYRRTSAKLFGVCLRILSVRHEAEEALQEVYISVWQRAGAFDPARGSAMTWLITLARNRAVDRLRSGARVPTAPIALADEVPDPTPSALMAIESSDDERRLAGCFDTLDERDARLVRTAFLEGSTYAELADRTSVPLGTIKSRIRRALIKLRDCLA
jgi:RNA polymerase sigma factor (sigma-70 family)